MAQSNTVFAQLFKLIDRHDVNTRDLFGLSESTTHIKPVEPVHHYVNHPEFMGEYVI